MIQICCIFYYVLHDIFLDNDLLYSLHHCFCSWYWIYNSQLCSQNYYMNNKNQENSLIPGSGRSYEWCCSSESFFFLRYLYSWLLLILTFEYSRWCSVSVIFLLSLPIFFFLRGTSEDFFIASWFCFFLCCFGA
jgi:hypothetical protein